MNFAAPWYLLLVLLVPVAIWALRSLEGQRRRTALEYADAPLLAGVLQRGNRAHSSWPRNLQLIALAALLFTASKPAATLSLPQNKAAIIIALDASRSMIATDVEPTRLAVAKSVIKKFVDAHRTGDVFRKRRFGHSRDHRPHPTFRKTRCRQSLEQHLTGRSARGGCQKPTRTQRRGHSRRVAFAGRAACGSGCTTQTAD